MLVHLIGTVFLLSYVPITSAKVMLTCRPTCLQRKKSKGEEIRGEKRREEQTRGEGRTREDRREEETRETERRREKKKNTMRDTKIETERQNKTIMKQRG